MNDFFRESLFAGVTLSLLSYFIGSVLKKKFKLGIFNPLLISIIITIIVLAVSGVDYDVYNQGARYLSWFLTPATVCLAIPLYEQWSLLKKNYKAVVVGIASGVLTSLTTVLVLSKIMNLSHAEYVTLLPKSITTAIGMGVSEELGGYVTITVAVIVVTGVLGNIFGELICKIFRIKEPIAKGLALGSAAHAIGTAKAMADIIGNENCVVVGRCGNNAFRHREDVISVFLTGNKEKRAELIEKKHNVSPKKAAKIVEDTDLRRCSYHNYYTGEEWGNAEYYDICIDVSKVGEDGALRLIEAYINETGVL